MNTKTSFVHHFYDIQCQRQASENTQGNVAVIFKFSPYIIIYIIIYMYILYNYIYSSFIYKCVNGRWGYRSHSPLPTPLYIEATAWPQCFQTTQQTSLRAYFSHKGDVWCGVTTLVMCSLILLCHIPSDLNSANHNIIMATLPIHYINRYINYSNHCFHCFLESQWTWRL